MIDLSLLEPVNNFWIALQAILALCIKQSAQQEIVNVIFLQAWDKKTL